MGTLIFWFAVLSLILAIFVTAMLDKKKQSKQSVLPSNPETNDSQNSINPHNTILYADEELSGNGDD